MGRLLFKALARLKAFGEGNSGIDEGRAMDFETVGAGEFGRSLTGIGLNLLVRDVQAEVAFLTNVFDMSAHQVTKDFAIMRYGAEVFQLHADGTYHSHPLPSLMPEAGPRGGGIALYLFETDPDAASAKAEAAGGHILQLAENKPHGLREAVILDENGYAWTPSRHLTPEEEAALG